MDENFFIIACSQNMAYFTQTEVSSNDVFYQKNYPHYDLKRILDAINKDIKKFIVDNYKAVSIDDNKLSFEKIRGWQLLSARMS